MTDIPRIEPPTSAEDSQHAVRQWLDLFGFEYTCVDGEVDGYSWVLRVLGQHGEILMVGWQDNMDALVIQATLDLQKPHHHAFHLLAPPERVVFLSSIGFTLGGMDLDYEITPESSEDDESIPDVNTPPKSVMMSDFILVDKPLYCSDFLSRFHRVRQSIHSIRHLFSSMALVKRW